MKFDPNTAFSRMFPDFYLPAMDAIPSSSFGPLPTSIFMVAGECWILNTSEWPNDGTEFSACSLEDVKEPDAPPKYWLSAKAARGILRRAEKRQKRLPPQLEAALIEVASRLPAVAEKTTTT